MAYNVLRLLRHRVFRAPAKRELAWRAVFDLIRDTLTNAAVWEPSGIA